MRRRTIGLFVSIILSYGAADAFDVDAALDSYRKQFAKSNGPVQTDEKTLFVIVDADVPSDGLGGIDRVVLTDTHKALLSWIDGGSELAETPFCPLLADFITPSVGFNLPSVQSVVVEHVVQGRHVRHVSAMDIAPLLALRSQIAAKKQAKRTIGEWAALLSDSRKNLRSDEERTLFMSYLGCPEAIVSVCPGPRCFGDRVDYVSLTKVLSEWNPTQADAAECREILAVIPSFSPAWKILAQNEERHEKWASAIACHLASLVGEPVPLDLTADCQSAKGEGGSSAWNEYASLLSRIAKVEPGRNTPFWKYVFQTAGHLDFTPSNHSDDGAFNEAMLLWKKGKDLPRIVELLLNSAEMNPARADVWKYLGAAYRASGDPERALVAYNEAMRLAPDDMETVIYQASLYQTLGYPWMASGAAWRVLLSDDSETRARIARDILAVNHSGTLAP